MKLTNNTVGEYQALLEEMLSKQQVLFIQFTLWVGVKISIKWLISLPFYIPQLGKSEAWKRYPFRAEPPYN